MIYLQVLTVGLLLYCIVYVVYLYHVVFSAWQLYLVTTYTTNFIWSTLNFRAFSGLFVRLTEFGPGSVL